MAEPNQKRPLEGVRVLAVEQFLAGPFCSMWLGDLGAEIIKIETPGKGDPRRAMPPTMKNDKGDTISGSFLEINRNKKSVTLDLKSEEGKRIFKELVRKADVVFENMKPGTMERLGLDYKVLREINPRIIYAALSGFGQMEGYRGIYWSVRPSIRSFRPWPASWTASARKADHPCWPWRASPTG